MEVADAGSVEGAAQLVCICRELDSMTFEHVARSTDRRTASVAVFADFVACSCHDEGGAGGYVEGVFAIAACAYDIECVIVPEVDVLACLY